MELKLYKTNWLSQQANRNFSWLPQETWTAIIMVLSSWVFAEMEGKYWPHIKPSESRDIHCLKRPREQLPQDDDGCTGPRVLREPAWCRIRHTCGPGTPGSPLLQSWMSVWKQLGNLCPFSPSSFTDWVPHTWSVPEPFFSTSPCFRISEEFLVTSYSSRGCWAVVSVPSQSVTVWLHSSVASVLNS